MLPDVDLVEERVELAGRELTLLRPPDAEALLDEEAFEHEEFLPYWAELWPSGLALARHVAGLQLAGLRVVELGAGLGLPSLAAALAGASVLATDWAPDAVALLRRNAAANGIELEVERVSWAEPDALLACALFDVALGADVLYERRNVEPLLALLPRLAAQALVADPRRPAAAEFLERARAAWRIETTELQSSPRVLLHRLRAGPA
jgi:predicted nicotinamide N-methyase